MVKDIIVVIMETIIIMNKRIKMLCRLAGAMVAILGSAIIIYVLGNIDESAVTAVNPESAVLCTALSVIVGIIILCKRKYLNGKSL